ncbi:hypothetical protein [Agriterribacter sp.]|uniref:hypothetical protein n=1 Tax=Agriterribacter sp. TaxID=2821509 RepID=UPI002C59A12F|nr:hypothetical protein [Agriterribacter sp.]HRP54648.1 hypothetical protein [Agriterribacter sp.]
MQKKGLGLLIAAAAAYGFYRFSKMTPEQKKAWKEKGMKFIDGNFGFGNLFGKKTSAPENNFQQS